MIVDHLARPWLIARLPGPMRILSHAPFGSGFVRGDSIAWREVKNSDLSPDFPVEDWFRAEMSRAPMAATVGMMTSRDVSSRVLAEAQCEGVRAAALVTLGLSNAEAVGRRLPWHSADGAGYGTVNILVATDAALTETAQIEALTIAVQARTAAIMDLGLDLPTGRATGTGTDCLALACEAGQGLYAGLHTATGEAVGAAVRAAVTRAGAGWMTWREQKRQERGALPPRA
ncbi:adenosylcobinamide amidohydrolase [Pseudogemmobacter bohemicus]|uniref:adenosylcobinamide amidohydrolase n=1 Tax=Pseudogemmobacter bohemicus TaxID=2250708 RepID=UPI000DD4B06D|nr:adenosylcobinamide amidohydrolase [Pseudogemmobacter bohemicus]